MGKIGTKKKGWSIENEGVIPDYEIDILPHEFETGMDPQLDKAIELILEKLENYPMKKPAPPPYPVKSKEKWIQELKHLQKI